MELIQCDVDPAPFPGYISTIPSEDLTDTLTVDVRGLSDKKVRELERIIGC